MTIAPRRRDPRRDQEAPHTLYVLDEADWIIDLGPDGGSGGGRVVVAGTPEAVVKSKSHTGVALKAVLKR